MRISRTQGEGTLKLILTHEASGVAGFPRGAHNPLRGPQREVDDAPKSAKVQATAMAGEATKKGAKMGKKSADDSKAAEAETAGSGSSASLPLVVNEPWAELAAEELGQLSDAGRRPWVELLSQCGKLTGSKPTKTCEKEATKLLAKIGHSAFCDALARWTPKIGRPSAHQRTKEMYGFNGAPVHPTELTPENIGIVRGLAFCLKYVDDPRAVGLLGRLADKGFEKVPNLGPRAPRLGNACLAVLREMDGDQRTPAIAQLLRIQGRVKNKTLLYQIEKAINLMAERAGLNRDDLEDLGVPDFGLDGEGQRVEDFSGFTATLRIPPNERLDATLTWTKPDGKAQKSIPKAAKDHHAAELKALQATQKDLRTLLPSIRDRIERTYLSPRSWPAAVWRERYVEHPVTGQVVRRLIWQASSGAGQVATTRSFVVVDGEMRDVDGKAVKLADDAAVSLWHPLGEPPEAVLAWRRRLLDLQIIQPFKQAHREVYLLTDAERTTHTYSNRFAAHIIKQGPLRALAQGRGWDVSLYGEWSGGSEHDPMRKLPAHELCAEWRLDVTGLEDADNRDGPQHPGVTFLASDHVRFTRLDGDEALPLETIPPVVFSEVMRDVDLFVGVGSIGADPMWMDRGEDPPYAEYWQRYSFGQISERGESRRQTLETLLPRLTIGKQCKLTDRFLEVQGNLAAYRIHLGSSNIQIMPTQHYLCIIQEKSSRQEQPMLPFEGDATLDLILSKAMLLAADDKIKDDTILSQLIAAGVTMGRPREGA